MSKRIAFASGSEHKLKEVRSLIEPLGYSVISPKDLGIKFNPVESETTFLGNSFIKSRALYELSGLPSFADDSGICVEALDGRPGVYSARFGEPSFTDKERANYLLYLLGTNSNRSAFYSCVITYVNGNVEKSFEGKVSGQITSDYDEMGKYGFGYDPVFYYPPFGKRFSEVPETEKNKVSHRAIAMNQFIDWLKT